MSEITPTPASNEMNLFKEDILKTVRELETKINSKISDKELTLKMDYEKFVSKINNLMDNNKEMVSTMVSQKLKLEKISELENFKNKVDSMLITHEIRIKNSLDEIEKMKTKYDKIVADNLYVNGYVGSSCQFRNLSEYISYNIAEVSKLKMEKEQLKKEIKEIKAKFEGIMKSMLNMNDNTAKLCNKYTDSKQIYFQNLLESAKEELNQKSLDMRVMTQQFQKDAEQKLQEMRNDVNKLIKSEENLNNVINDNFYICEKQHEEIKKDIGKGNDNISINKTNLKKLDEKIQNLQPKLNLIDVINSKVSKMFETVKDLSSRSELNRNNNIPLSKSIQSPSPRRIIKRKNSNPDLFKINGDNNNIKNFMNNNENTTKKSPNKQLLQKSVKFPIVKNLNLNRITNTTPSIEELNKSKRKEEKNQEIKKSTILEENNNTNQENNKSMTNNENIIEKENEKEIIIDKVNEPIKETIKEPIKEIIKEKEKEKEMIIAKPSILKNANLTNAIETLPVISIEGRRSSKHIILKPLETEISNGINENSKNYNVLTFGSNDSHTQTNPNLTKLKKIGSQIKTEERGCKVVSLKLSPDNSKEGLSKSRRPPKAQYNIVNSLINDYRAKLFSKIHSPEQMNDMNNEIFEMPKKVSQAFGRTTYTFYFNKDNFGSNTQKKGNLNLKAGLKNENDNKIKK